MAIDSTVLAAQVELLAPVRAMDAYELRLAEDGGIVWVDTVSTAASRPRATSPARIGSKVKNLLLHPFVPEGSL